MPNQGEGFGPCLGSRDRIMDLGLPHPRRLLPVVAINQIRYHARPCLYSPVIIMRILHGAAVLKYRTKTVPLDVSRRRRGRYIVFKQ